MVIASKQFCAWWLKGLPQSVLCKKSLRQVSARRTPSSRLLAIFRATAGCFSLPDDR